MGFAGEKKVHATAVVAASARIASTASVAAQAVVEDGAVVGEDCRVGSAAVLLAGCNLGPGVEVGARALVAGGVAVGARAQIAPGAVVIRNVPPGAVVAGHPAVITGYVDSMRLEHFGRREPAPGQETVAGTTVRGVTLHRLQLVRDLRGGMTVGEFERTVPFRPLRYYVIFDVPTSEVRGEHAHRECHGFLICVNGSCSVVVDDGTHREELTLAEPSVGLYRPPMIWSTQYKYSRDAVLLVFASHYYDAADYIRDYDEFCALARPGGRTS